MKLFLQRSKVEVPKKFNEEQKTSQELDRHYSGGGRWLSEGGNKPIYYVGGDDKYSVIEANGHSQGKRNLGGGKEVGAYGHRGFGPREFPFKKSKGEEKKEGEAAINRYLKEIKRLQKDELKQLSDFLNKYDDEQGCEIIDVIWNCAQFKKDLMDNRPTEIKKELNLSLEELTKLSGHDEINTAGEDLKTVIAKAISIKKIKNYMSGISDYGVDWYKEYYENKKDDEKVNPVRLIADVGGNSNEIGFDCDKKNGEGWEYFKECNQEAGLESGKKVKVIRVLKPTAEREDNRKGNYYVPIKRGSTSGVSNGELTRNLRTKYRGGISSKGKLGELIVETCDHKSSWFSGGQDTFCKEILQKFFGDDVKDKRYCLYEMPETEEDLTSATFFKKRIKNNPD